MTPSHTTGTQPMITFDHVSKTFAGRPGRGPSRGPAEIHAVDDVSLDIATGEVFGVIGSSGAGKSTLVRLVNGLEQPTAGRVVVDGHEVSTMTENQLRRVRPDIGMIFQQFNLFQSRTVAGNVGYPLRLAGVDAATRTRRVAELLDFVGLGDRAAAHPSQLSGGQKQRVGIARALATNPKILLADEATSALDPQTTQEVLALLRRANTDLGLTIMLITHEMDVVRRLCDRVAVMQHGRVLETGSVHDVFSAPQHAVTANFVHTALHDRPSPDVLARLAQRHPGRLVSVGVSDGPDAGDRTALFAHHGIDAQIIYGGIVEVGERPHGSLTYVLNGPDAAVDAALDQLRQGGGVEEHLMEVTR